MKNMGDNESGGNRFLFGGNRDDDSENVSSSDPDTDNSSDSSVFRTFMGGGSDGPRLFGSDDSSAPSTEPELSPDSIPHLNYKPEDLEFDESYPLTLDKPIFKRLEPEMDEVPAPQPEVTKPDTAEPDAAQPFYAEPSYPQPEVEEPSIPEPDYSVPDTAQPFYAEPSYPQPEAEEPSIPEPDYTVPDAAQPFHAESSYPQPEAAEPSIPEPDYTEPEAAQPYDAEPAYQQTEEPAYQQTEESAAPAVDTYESSVYDDYSDTSSVPDTNTYAGNPVYADSEPYPEEFDDASGSGSTGSSSETDAFADDDDEMSDTAFPLFLSFKANDSSSVSEAIREKNVQRSAESTSKAASGKSAASKQPVDEQTYNKMLNEAEPAVFKPYEAADESENAYDIPSVSSQNRGSDRVDAQEPAPTRPVFKQQESRPAPSSRSASAKSETDSAADSDTTVRPGTRYYPAAQQMGYAAPMPQRELSKRKKKKHGPLIITLALATVLVAGFFIWTRLDIGRMLADGDRNTTATTTEASSSNETSSVPAVVTTTSTPTPKATATPTPKATATPTPKATVTPTPKATATPTPKATATPTPKATATPTPKATATPTPKATATPTPKATATPTPKATATPTPKATATPTPKATATPTPKATPTPAPTSGESAQIPSGFSTSITDGSAKGDTATFNIQFKNLGKTDVSLFDGVEYITITFSASGSPVTSVTSDSFTFSPDPKHANTFIGIPTDKEVIAKKDTKTVGITGVTDGKNVGKYTIKYFVKTY